MSDELKMDDLVIEAYGTVTLPAGWHYDANGEPVQDDAEATQHEEGCE